jgi:hypothetical protein
MVEKGWSRGRIYQHDPCCQQDHGTGMVVHSINVLHLQAHYCLMCVFPAPNPCSRLACQAY